MTTRKHHKLENPVWQKQSWETEEQFGTFVKFRDIPTHVTRSIPDLAKELGVVERTLYNRANTYRWHERVLAYDRYHDSIKLRQIKRESVEMAERQSYISKFMQSLVLKRLQTLDPESLTARDCKDWMEVASKIELRARGEATETVSYSYQDGRDKLVSDAKEHFHQMSLEYPLLSDEEKAQIIKDSFGVEPHEIGVEPTALDPVIQDGGAQIN